MPEEVKAHITGVVFQITSKAGDRLAAGDPVVVLESMKMEIPVEAPRAGVVREIKVAEGVQVSVHYDPLLAKVVTWGDTRDEAIARMQGALDGFVVEGVRTVIPFHQRVLASAAFRAGRVHTQMVEQGGFNA